MTYLYIYTGDRQWEERIEKGVEWARKGGFTPESLLFCVNDVKGIEKVQQLGFKALNLDAPVDLINLATKGDQIYLLTPEEIGPLPTYFPNLHRLKLE
jgi:hypothetical protein